MGPAFPLAPHGRSPGSGAIWSSTGPGAAVRPVSHIRGRVRGAVLLLRGVAVGPVLDGPRLVAAEHALRPEDAVESAVTVTTTNVDALTQAVKVLFV